MSDETEQNDQIALFMEISGESKYQNTKIPKYKVQKVIRFSPKTMENSHCDCAY